jgi:predicted HTH transcriptional regulator
MKCKCCNRQLSDNESYEYLGEILCEDCYIDKYQASITACEPLAVHAATRSRKKLGLEGVQGLTDQQRAIYEFVKNQGRATREEIMQKLNLTGSQIQAQLAILRHCQLVKGQKEGNQIYLVPFS